MTRRARRLLAQLRHFVEDYERVYERRELLNRPWEQDFVHWSWNGREWELHGHLAPPPDGRRRGATADGWCPCRARRPSHPPD